MLESGRTGPDFTDRTGRGIAGGHVSESTFGHVTEASSVGRVTISVYGGP